MAARTTTWQGRPARLLESPAVRIVAVPSLGGRVVSLLDRRSGREWLVQGEEPPGNDDFWAADDAVFGGREAFGWDECAPTVAPCPDPRDPDGPPLRDHGASWGRPIEFAEDPDRIVTAWADPRWPFRMSRTITVEGATVVARYAAWTDAGEPLPLLWSMHALLALAPGTTLLIEPPVTGSWPVPLDGAGDASTDTVLPIDAGVSAKLYLPAGELSRVAARGVDGAEIRFDWDRAFAPVLGVWLDYGGWPAGAARHQVALEPTTSAHDTLEAAQRDGSGVSLRPGEVVRWQVTMELVAPG
jgi:hypothetical protein